MLHYSLGLTDKQFQHEITNLMKIRHQNIVQLVGYCSETKSVLTQANNGEYVISDKADRAMCFEYSVNGSLDQYNLGIHSGLDWRTRYGIIEGTCEGLRYLHEGLPSPIIHMNVKPSNIFVDENMVAKLENPAIRLFNDKNSMMLTGSIVGTIEYIPPEFIDKQVISEQYDIYSLGVVIIEIVTGERYHRWRVDISSVEFLELVYKRWRKRLKRTVKGMLSVEGYCREVKKCLEMAFRCVEHDRLKRPSIGDILHMLNETPSLELLDVHPLELCFMCDPRKGKQAMISCSLQLNNNMGNDRVAFMLVANSPKRYLTKKPLCGVVPPSCAYTLTITMPKQLSDDSGDFFTLHSVPVGEYDLQDVGKDSVAVEYGNFFKKAKETDGEVQETDLGASICYLPAAQQTSCFSFVFAWLFRSPEVIWQPTRSTVEILTTPDAQQVSSIDVHPTEPWIMTTNRLGTLGVWNYHIMATVASFQVTDEPVYAAKFIAREKWVVAGDGNGGIHVYNYCKHQAMESLDAHDSCITTLAVHPTDPFVLSSSDDEDHLIKLWDWGNSWKCTRTFRGHVDRVTQLTFNPQDTNSFASASLDGVIKIWSIDSGDESSNIITLNDDSGGLLCVDYFTRHNRQHLITGCKDKTAQIWGLGTMEGCVEKLEGHVDPITAVNLHPELPILMTGSHDGTVRIWNSTTYKLENIISFNLGAVYAFGCIKGSRRIVAGCHQGIATMEI